MCLQYKSFENTVGKGEIACNEQFLLFPVFSAIFVKFKIVVCKLFQFGIVQNLSFGKVFPLLFSHRFHLLFFNSVNLKGIQSDLCTCLINILNL